MMYIGLTMTSAAQFQMLRGSIMIFVGLLSIVFLKKKLEWFRWAGMAVIAVRDTLTNTLTVPLTTT